MSANRSVQAAQRRRAGPTNADPGIPGRGPQTSINSAQMFANQARPGAGPNIPVGRLSAQQAVAQQQQQMQQTAQTKQEGLSTVNKMTLAQAITLITLRLGAVETKLINLQENGIQTNNNSLFGNEMGNENMILIDKNVINSITSRLESLEKRSTNSSGPEMNLIKQQIETIKTAVIQTKNTFGKENRDLLVQINNLKQDLEETKNLIHTLTVINNENLLDSEINNNELSIEDVDYNIVGTNLKELIEKEVNESMT